MLSIAVGFDFDDVEDANASLGTKIDLVVNKLPDISIGTLEMLVPVRQVHPAVSV